MTLHRNESIVNVFAPVEGASLLVMVLGPPGAGKTTLSRSLSDLLRADLVSASGYLSDIVASGSSENLKAKIQENFRRGTNTDEDEFHSEFQKKILSSNSDVVVVDGYPRTKKGALGLCEAAKNQGKKMIVVHAYAPKATCRERFVSKSFGQKCDEIFVVRMENYVRVERRIMSEIFSEVTINVLTG